MSNLNWGETMPGGLRMAWVVEPRAEKYHRSSALNASDTAQLGDKPVMFVTRSFHQPEHKAATTGGTTVPVTSSFWTTIGRPEPYRLHPGEYCEVSAPGIGTRLQNKELEDWSNVRAGSWILADEGDEIIFRPGEILLTGDHAEDPLGLVAEICHGTHPLCDTAAGGLQRTRGDSVSSDLGSVWNSPTPEEAAGFLADNSPQAVENLAKVLSGGPGTRPSPGRSKAEKSKFTRCLKIPRGCNSTSRIATNPGHYNLGEEVRFVVSRRPIGETLMNEADLIWYPPGQDNVPRKYRCRTAMTPGPLGPVAVDSNPLGEPS